MPAPATDLPVLIVGAGYSGTLLAIHLLRHGAKVVVVERDAEGLAHGIAFGTRRPEHLLNVRASNMSAYADDPEHFVRWMQFGREDRRNRFVPRLVYGRYLREQMVAAMSASPGRLLVRPGEAVSVDRTEAGLVLTLDSGARLVGRALVIAAGNAAPQAPRPLAALAPPHFCPHPWMDAAVDGLESIDEILLLGSGLTAIDATLSLIGAGFRGRITALSRRGLMPRAHAWIGPQAAPVPCPTARGVALLRHVRRRAAQVGWRVAVDELRPHTQALWRAHDVAAQARFLRHLRPWWDVHRHRIAPQVYEQIEALAAEGRFRVLAGRLQAAEAEENRLRFTWRPRGAAQPQSMTVGRVIACTGVDCDITHSDNPLLMQLQAAGWIRPDPHRLGIDVDAAGHVRGADGRADPAILALGPITKGEAWEIIAVPDIRQQVAAMAAHLAP